MIDETIRRNVVDLCGNDVVVFDEPSFDRSIVGITTDDRAIYDFDNMVRELMNDSNCTYDEAVEFISYNTLEKLPYVQNPPVIIMYDRSDILEEWH